MKKDEEPATLRVQLSYLKNNSMFIQKKEKERTSLSNRSRSQVALNFVCYEEHQSKTISNFHIWEN